MADKEPTPDSGPRVIVYKGTPSPSVASVNQHGPKSAKKADVNPSASDAGEAFNKFTAASGKDQLIDPPFDFDAVADLGEKNSILPPLIQAMVVNIDGTGAEIIDDDTAAADESEAGKKKAENERIAIREYFDEPFPGESFLTQRRAMRNEQERIGNAYLEVMRNALGEVVFWKPITPAKNMRLVRLDDPVDVVKVVTRNGKDQQVTVPVRERRFVQAVGTNVVWFKEFGASRDVNRETGEWAPKGSLDFGLRGNEIIHFKNQSDPFSPYGLPRWWSNSPSVVGSRRAEEFNLLFFDSGGIPPMMLIVSGGALATEAEKALRDHFLATGANRHAAVVLEAYSTGGNVDNPSNVKIQVERFGSERQNDCHDAETEVLTQGGWVRFSDLKPQAPVGTMNPDTTRLEWQVPTKHVEYEYDGPMHLIKSKHSEALVTPNHDLYTSRRTGGRYRKIKAVDAVRQQAVFSAPDASVCVGWTETEIADSIVSAKAFGYVLGLYLGDGCATRSIRLGAKNPDKIANFELGLKALAEDIGGDVRRYDSNNGAISVELYAPSIAAWMTLEAGSHAHVKVIPEMAFSMSLGGREALLKGLLDTDGQSSRKGTGWSYNTVSRKLADGVQRLGLSLGWRAAISEDEIPSGSYYRVRLSRARETYIQQPEVVFYKGKVYCVEVENHLVVTRRNGRPIVTGNSMFEKYIENCDKRVQRSFRIPGQFIGMSDDFTFATALSSMMVAEAQVFACERQEFDEIINLKLMPELPNGEKYLYRSKTLALRDAERQLVGLALIQSKIPPKTLVERVGETIGMPDLTLTDEDVQVLLDKETADRDAKARQPVVGAIPPGAGEGKDPKTPKKKFEFSPGMLTMAQEMAEVLQIGLARPEEIARFRSVRKQVETLDDGQREQFRKLLTAHMLPALENDPDGAQELVAHALDVTTREVEGR